MKNIFSTVLYTNHSSIYVSDIMATINSLLSIAGSKIIRGPISNSNIAYAYVELEDQGVIEVVSPNHEVETPFPGNSFHIDSGAYYPCYTVPCVDSIINSAGDDISSVIFSPIEHFGFEKRFFVTVKHEQLGTLQFIEQYPRDFNFGFNNETNNKGFESSIFTIFNRIVSKTSLNFSEVSMDSVPEWDSFKHLLLIMELESFFELKIPAEEIANLSNLKKILNFISRN